MKITLIGHASVLFETPDLRILMDPVFVDPHQEGTLEVFPRRTLVPERMPEYELLVLSHRHLDHFDIATLARLSRDVEVLAPQDELIVHVLRELGYERITAVQAGFSLEFGTTRLRTTPSNAPHPELGLIVRDADGTVWNQVDTVLGDTDVADVLVSGPIDLLLATWQPMLELQWQNHDSPAFPLGEYARYLANVARIRPRALVPASNGFRYCGGAEWMNHVVFPQTRERFMADVVAMVPELAGSVFEFDPGDELELRDGATTHHRRASPFVTSDERDPFELEFLPATARAPLRDRPAYPALNMREEIETFITHTFPAAVRAEPEHYELHRRWGVVYQLEVALRESSLWWYADFRRPGVVLEPGRTPLANIACGITANALYGLITGSSGWDYAACAGNYYQLSRTYGVWENGLVFPGGVELTNPLVRIFPSGVSLARITERQLAEFRPVELGFE